MAAWEPGMAVLGARLERRDRELYGAVDEVRGGWETDRGPVVPGSTVKVARGGDPREFHRATPLAVGTAEGRLVLCAREHVRPGEWIAGTVTWAQLPGGHPARGALCVWPLLKLAPSYVEWCRTVGSPVRKG